MEIVKIEIDKLINDPANVRKHSKRNIDAIKSSLVKFGQQKPIVVDKKNTVIAGNGTLQAAKLLGWKQISVVETELEDKKKLAFALADNRTAELAEWDDDLLKKQLADLHIHDIDVSDLGFDDIKIDLNSKKKRDKKDVDIEDDDEILIIISCGSEQEQSDLFEELKERGLDCKIM